MFLSSMSKNLLEMMDKIAFGSYFFSIIKGFYQIRRAEFLLNELRIGHYINRLEAIEMIFQLLPLLSATHNMVCEAIQ